MFRRKFFLPSPIFLGRNNFNFLSLLLICLVSQIGYSQNTETPKNADAAILESGKSIERELAGQQKHGYQIKLSANQYIKITIEQRGIDVAAHLIGLDGKPIADFDAEARPNGVETIEFVADADGVYRFDVSAKYPLLPAGRYEISFAESRAATGQDKSLQQARNFYTESVRFFSAGKYDEAKKSIERSLEIYQKESGAESSLTAAALIHLSRILDEQGSYEEAEKISLQVLATREKLLGADHPDVANTLNYLAIVYSDNGDFQKAVVFHQRALEIKEKVFGQTHPTVAVSLINLGLVYDNLGDKIKARELYERALKIQEQTVGANNLNAAVVLNNIGKLYNDSDEYEKAEPYILKAIAILEKLYAPDHPRTLEPLFNLAVSCAGQGKLDEAETLYLRLISGFEKLFGANHPYVARATYNLANLYTLRRDFAKAEPLYRRALEIDENALGPENPRVSADASALALLLAERGDIEQAVKLQERAGAVDERNISLNLAIGSERQKLAYLDDIFEWTNQSIFMQAQYAKENPLAIELAATTILRQKGRVLDAVSNNLIELRRRFNPQDQTLLDNLNKVTKKASELILNGPEDEDIAAHQAKIKSLVDEREKLEDEISRRAAGFFVKSAPVTLQEIQAVIPPEAALVEFAVYYTDTPESAAKNTKTVGEARYAAYILHNRGKVEWADLGDAKQINEVLEAYREALRDPKRTDVQTLARAADAQIMQPVRALLGDSKQLLISPDGELNLIPFEALFDAQGHYLIENYSFTYLTSGRDLLRMQVPRASKNKPLIIADPTFGAPVAEQTNKDDTRTITVVRRGKNRSVTAARDLPGVYFTQLSGTTQEARSIQNIFPDATFLTGAQATESALKQATAPEILHIATHGFFLQDSEIVNPKLPVSMRGLTADSRNENPLMRSGLALAGANRRGGTGDDGILTALEASGLNLWGTKLVVLSACDTGIGEVKNGEGVYGLRRSFVLAGAESLVMSLWSVSDYATRELMTNYYKNLKQGMGRGASLRQVQLEMLKKKGRTHPFYWAAFIQSGEWANLDGKR